MSNHLGDTNKMVSDTPRMDASAHDDGAIWQTGCDIERELTAANDRIKRLEDRIHRAAMAFFEDVPDDSVASGMLAILEEERGKK